MLRNKVLIGGLVGGVVFFLLGWLLYGILLKDYMATTMNNCAMLPMEEMIWWAIIVSNFAYGFFIAVMIGRTKSYGLAGGALLGATIGLLVTTAMDMSFYSMSTVFPNLTAVLVDIMINTFYTAVGGGVIGLVMGMGNKPAAH